MSKIALSGNANGSGTFTIASPNSNSDRILNLPDSAGTLATSESTLTQFSASGSAPVFAARAWVNFNGTGTVAIRASGNVSSISDLGVGDYRVNFTNAMPDANYAVSGTAENFNTGTQVNTCGPLAGALTVNNVRVVVRASQNPTGGNVDAGIICIAIFR